MIIAAFRYLSSSKLLPVDRKNITWLNPVALKEEKNKSTPRLQLVRC